MNDNQLKNNLLQIKNKEIEVQNISNHVFDSQISKKSKVLNLECSVLFVDIRHSTQILDIIGRKNMVKIFKMFAKLVIQAVEENNGYVDQIMGDGMLCTFVNDNNDSSGNKAVNAAIAINYYLENVYNKIVDSNWSLTCGIGIMSGHIYLTRIGLRGKNRCSKVAYPSAITNYSSKLCANANGKEILIDENTYNQIKDVVIHDKFHVLDSKISMLEKIDSQVYLMNYQEVDRV